MAVEVHGIDMMQGAYRISIRAEGRTIRGLLPETLVAENPQGTGRPEHEDVYKWIAAHSRQIEKALTRMSRGDTQIRAPYDRLSLVEE